MANKFAEERQDLATVLSFDKVLIYSGKEDLLPS
jgi:hypothetical protein